MSRNVIEATGLSIRFDGVSVLKEVNFALKEGEVHGLVGQNGAGKSTLMKIINGFYQADSGLLKVFGSPCHFLSTKESQTAGIAMVYQDLSLVPTLSVADNIFLMKYRSKKTILLDNKQAIKETGKLLDLIGINTEINPGALVETLSVGQQQLVEIAKALSSDSKILILDEPTASLSNAEIDILFQVIERLKEKGISIIYITHYLKDIFRICDSVTVLRDGQCVFNQSVTQTSVSEIVKEMLGKEIAPPQKWYSSTPMDAEERAAQRPLLEFRKVTTSKINNVSFELFPGQIIGFAGLLGSGRTEILNAIFGLDKIFSGEFLFHGVPVSIKSPQDALALGISLVPEDRRKQGLVLDFSVEDNVLLPIYSHLQQKLLINKNRGKKIVDRLIDYLNVKTQGRNQIVRYLSGGNQQKVVIAKCLSSASKVLLLDDPTFGIDMYSKYEIMKIVKEYVDNGNGVIFVSSEYSEIAAFCDQTYIVNKGQIVDLIDNTNLTEDDLLQVVQ